MVFPLQYNMCCLSLCQICNSFIYRYTERRREANSSIQALSLSGALHVLLMHCSLCVLYPTQLKGTLKNLPYYYYKLIIFISLSLCLDQFPFSSLQHQKHEGTSILQRGSALITSIIPLCCVVPDTVNDNQWTNNNLAGLIMQNHVNTTVSHTLVNMSILHSGAESRVIKLKEK